MISPKLSFCVLKVQHIEQLNYDNLTWVVINELPVPYTVSRCLSMSIRPSSRQATSIHELLHRNRSLYSTPLKIIMLSPYTINSSHNSHHSSCLVRLPTIITSSQPFTQKHYFFQPTTPQSNIPNALAMRTRCEPQQHRIRENTSNTVSHTAAARSVIAYLPRITTGAYASDPLTERETYLLTAYAYFFTHIPIPGTELHLEYHTPYQSIITIHP